MYFVREAAAFACTKLRHLCTVYTQARRFLLSGSAEFSGGTVRANQVRCERINHDLIFARRCVMSLPISRAPLHALNRGLASLSSSFPPPRPTAAAAAVSVRSPSLPRRQYNAASRRHVGRSAFASKLDDVA